MRLIESLVKGVIEGLCTESSLATVVNKLSSIILVRGEPESLEGETSQESINLLISLEKV